LTAVEQARPVDVVPMMLASCGLSKRENEVTRLVLLGLPVRRIAHQLSVSADTVRTPRTLS
jgi:DNA-binding CsgD family transcriptional regulator